MSFVFGLEINWDLLQLREEETKEENELRKQQNKKDLEELNERRRKQRLTDAGEDDVDEDGEGDNVDAEEGEGDEGGGDVDGDEPEEQPVLVTESRSSKGKKAGKVSSSKGKVIREEGEKAPKKGKSERKPKKPAESDGVVLTKKKNKSRSKSGPIVEVIDIFDDDNDEDEDGGVVDSLSRQGEKAKAGHATPTVAVDCIDDDEYIFDDGWAEPDEPLQQHNEPTGIAKASLVSTVVCDGDLKKQRNKRRIIDDDDDDEVDLSVQSSSVLLDITNKAALSSSLKSSSPLAKKKKSAIEEEEIFWSCSHCTYNNEFKNEKRPKCTICG